MTSSALVMRVFTKNNRILRSKQTREQWLSQLRLRRRLKSFVVPSIVIKHLWTTASEFVNEMLIFRSSRSQMFFKISVLKNFAILEPLSNNKVTDLLLQNTYGACFWIFVAANTFFLLNMVFIADSRTGFCSGLLWKHELNLRSSHWSCS